MKSVWEDVRFALRVLRRSPGFALAAIACLALGIGANTVVFSVVYSLFIRSLPYTHANELVRVDRNSSHDAVTFDEYEFWKRNTSAFAIATGHRGAEERSLMVAGDRDWIHVMPITGDFFRTLSVPPLLGREFDGDELQTGGPNAIVLSYSLWSRTFNSDPQVLGRSVNVSDVNYMVVGVLPETFWFAENIDAFVPLQRSGTGSDNGSNIEMIARLKTGLSLQSAEAQMPAVSQSFKQAGFAGNSYRGLTLTKYQEWLTGDIRFRLLLLFVAVGVLLVIACLNLAILLLAKFEARQQEIAIRLALGSSATRLLRQFLVENILLTLIGCLTGLIITASFPKILVAVVRFPSMASHGISLDPWVLVFALTIALVTALFFSLPSYLKSRSLVLHDSLSSATRSTGAHVSHRARSLLVIIQVAMSATLLVLAALLIKSLYRMHQEPLGFDAHNRIVFRIPTLRSKGSQRWTDEAALLEKFHVVPGVRNVAAVNVLPLTGQNNFPVERAGHPDQDVGGTEIRHVTPDYFKTMGIPVLHGRSFNINDTSSSAPVIVINEALARQFWPQGNALGDRVVVGRFRGHDYPGLDEMPREIVGIAGNTKTVYLKEQPRPTVFLPVAQAPWYTGSMVWIVEADEVSPGLIRRLKDSTATITPHQVIDHLVIMDDVVSSTMTNTRSDAFLFGGFAILAISLTATGIYGLLSFFVTRRTRDFGIRIALGANRFDVLRVVAQQGLVLIALGLLAGMMGALFLSRVVRGLLFGLGPTDPMSFLAAFVLLLLVGALASYVPTRRALAVDPVVALRSE